MRQYGIYQWEAGERLKYYLAASLLLSALGWLFYRHWAGSLAVALLSVPLMPFYEKKQLQKMRRSLYEELRDMLYALSSGFATGAGLAETMEDCRRALWLSYGEKGLLWKEASFIARAIEGGNASGVALLLDLAERSCLPEIKQVAVIYSLCLRTGGDLPRAMVETSDALLRRLQLWEEVEAATAQKRMEFTVMEAMIPLLLVAVNSASDYLAPLYCGIWGRTLMTVALLGLIGSLLWSAWIMEGGRR